MDHHGGFDGESCHPPRSIREHVGRVSCTLPDVLCRSYFGAGPMPAGRLAKKARMGGASTVDMWNPVKREDTRSLIDMCS